MPPSHLPPHIRVDQVSISLAMSELLKTKEKARAAAAAAAAAAGGGGGGRRRSVSREADSPHNSTKGGGIVGRRHSISKDSQPAGAPPAGAAAAVAASNRASGRRPSLTVPADARRPSLGVPLSAELTIAARRASGAAFTDEQVCACIAAPPRPPPSRCWRPSFVLAARLPLGAFAGPCGCACPPQSPPPSHPRAPPPPPIEQAAAAVRLQAAARGRSARLHAQEETEAARRIQAFARGRRESRGSSAGLVVLDAGADAAEAVADAAATAAATVAAGAGAVATLLSRMLDDHADDDAEQKESQMDAELRARRVVAQRRAERLRILIPSKQVRRTFRPLHPSTMPLATPRQCVPRTRLVQDAP